MIVVSNLDRPWSVPAVRAGTVLASVDVEWTKNYRVRNGNRPFCLSVAYLLVPAGRQVELERLPLGFTSVYVESDAETAELVARADKLFRVLHDDVDVLTGHQLSSDLAVLAAQGGDVPSIAEMRSYWHGRRGGGLRPAVVDTRYDAGHLLAGASRRLVDVCAELDLDVTQPELRGTSMTALHRTWIDGGRTDARERISVLNLRHSLSTGLVALRAIGRADWSGPADVNRLLVEHAAGAWDWLDSPLFPTAGVVSRR